MSFYKALAVAKTMGKSDGDFFLPNQKGVIVIEQIINKFTETKKTVILVAEILSSDATVAGAPTQPAGTKVKKLYPISKRDWEIDRLKTDLVSIAGVDEGDLSPKQLESMFEEVFEKGALVGVAANFNTSTKKRDGKVDLTSVFFSPADESINTPEEVEKRKIAIEAKLKKK